MLTFYCVVDAQAFESYLFITRNYGQQCCDEVFLIEEAR